MAPELDSSNNDWFVNFANAWILLHLFMILTPFQLLISLFSGYSVIFDALMEL